MEHTHGISKSIKTAAAILAMSLALGSLTSCSLIFNKFEYNQFYSDIKDEAITDKDDINRRDSGIFMKTCAGFVNALDDRDAEAIEKLCCDQLLDMDSTEDLIDAMLDGFEGDVTDTSLLATDLSSNTFSQWSKTDPIDYYENDFFIFTTEQTYWVSISMYSIVGDDDLIGINCIKILTADKRFNMSVEADPGIPDGDSIARYRFADGTACDLVYYDTCGMLVCYGDSDGYIVVNYGAGTVYDAFKLTGGGDEIDRDDLDDLDWTDEEGVYEFLSEYEPYAIGGDSSVPNYYKQVRFYLIEDSDKILYASVVGDDGVPAKVTFAEIFDPTVMFTDQKVEVLHSFKDK